MRVPFLISLICGLFLLSPINSWAGGMIAFFGPDDRRLPEKLSHLDNKALIVEFRDPEGSELGRDIALVLWREVLNAISDQKGAGVIVARRPKDRPIIDMEKGEYHEAAIRIAESQRTWAAVWGNVSKVKDKLFIESYLSLLPRAVQIKPLIQIYVRGHSIPELSVPMLRSLFSFKLAVIDFDGFFKRTLVTRKKVELHGEPDENASIVANIASGQAVQMLSMKKSWLKLRDKNGVSGYVRMVEDSPVNIPPSKIKGRGNRIRLRTSPDTSHSDNIYATINLTGEYTVLDQQYISGEGSWIKIDYKSEPVWVASWLVDSVYSMPMVELVAGLLRYQVNNYERAAQHFQRYIELSKNNERNVNLAAAHQLLGAALMKKGHAGAGKARKSFQAAAIITPFDPNAYVIQALASIRGDIRNVLPQLNKALSLDKSNALARSLTNVLSDVSKGEGPIDVRRNISIDNNSRIQLKNLIREYEISGRDRL